MKKKGDTVVYIGWDRKIMALFVISDVIRDEAIEVMDELRKAKTSVSIVSGDNRITTSSIVSMVGIAMGRGTDVAMESADAVLIRDDLKLIPYFMNLSKKTFSIVKQNIFWAFFYNVIAIPLAVLGVLHLIIAAGAMAVSSLFVVENLLRIKTVGRIQEV